ncbi:hypothetical protein AVEN_1982-1 [Araneus ventricosus]|uniref:Uncharacterized protein n=1 Tax=Araneus ventricosus TaxID=182803 RepID=A0A4Y2R0W3_ARAVE|nr:hypothetical protein AVEN_1982-1 [Araneus ventricosus]
MLFVFSALCFITAAYGQSNVDDIYDEYPFYLNSIDTDLQNKTDDLDEVYSLNYPYVYLPSADYAVIPHVGHQPIILGIPPHRLLIPRNISSNSGNETTSANQTSTERPKVPVAHEAIASLRDLINKTSSTGNQVGSSLDVGRNNTADLKITDVPRNNVTNSTEDSSQRLPTSVYAVNLNHFGPYLFPFSGHAATDFHPGTYPLPHVYGPSRHPLIL